jgi:hypothetical protein
MPKALPEDVNRRSENTMATRLTFIYVLAAVIKHK